MQAPELDRAFGFLVHDVSRLMRKRFEQRVKGYGLTRAQWHLMAYLTRNEGAAQGALADMLEIEPITLTRLVDRMVVGGWLERHSDHADRRVRTLFLTEKARDMIREMRVIGTELTDETLNGLSPAERERLIDALILVRGNLTSEVRPQPVMSEALTGTDH